MSPQHVVLVPYTANAQYTKRGRDTALPCRPKTERSYENIRKPKWHKAKKRVPLISMGKGLSIPRPPNHLSYLGFSDTLEHLLRTDAQNK